MPYGPVALFGSGETSRHGRRAHEAVFRRLAPPVRVAILETPAGFQPNVAAISTKLRDFFQQSLRNYAPEVRMVPARRRGGVYDPDAPLVIEPLERANYLFAGPGSPTYCVRHLAGTRTYDLLCRRWAEGAAVSLASAAAIAFGRFALPVYEIYKVGEDLHWVAGLDLFRAVGLDLTILPHWNNSEGGSELDTSHCFAGAERFRYLRRMLPPTTTILAIDEQTACVLDPEREEVEVFGAGQARVIRGQQETAVPSGERFGFDLLRPPAAQSASAPEPSRRAAPR